MDIPGRVEHGIIVLEGQPVLPEGAAVTVTYPAVSNARPAGQKQRIVVPLVRTGEPGTVELTGGRIAATLDREDAEIRLPNHPLQLTR